MAAAQFVPELAGLDLTIIGAYFATVLVIGFWVARRTRTPDSPQPVPLRARSRAVPRHPHLL